MYKQRDFETHCINEAVPLTLDTLTFLVILITALTVTTYAQTQENKLSAIADTMSACETDEECVHVGLSGCPCNSGGETGVINKKFLEEFTKKRKSLIGKGPGLCPAWYRCINQQPKCYKNKCLISSESFIEEIMREKSFEEFKKVFADFKDEAAEKGNSFLEGAIRLRIPAKEAGEITRQVREHSEALEQSLSEAAQKEEGNPNIRVVISTSHPESKKNPDMKRSEDERLEYIKFLISQGIKPTKSLFDLMLRNSTDVNADDFKIAEYFIKDTNMPKTIPYYFFDAYYTHGKYSNFKTNSTRNDQNAEKKKQFFLKNGFSIDFTGRANEKDYQINHWLQFDGDNRPNRLFLLAFKALPYTDPYFREIYETQMKETADCPDLTEKCGTIRLALKILELEYKKLPAQEPVDKWNIVHEKIDAKKYRVCAVSDDCAKINFENCGGETVLFTVNKNKLNTIKEDISLLKTIRKAAKDEKCSYGGVSEVKTPFPLPTECIDGKCTTGIFPSFFRRKAK